MLCFESDAHDVWLVLFTGLEVLLLFDFEEFISDVFIHSDARPTHSIIDFS